MSGHERIAELTMVKDRQPVHGIADGGRKVKKHLFIYLLFMLATALVVATPGPALSAATTGGNDPNGATGQAEVVKEAAGQTGPGPDYIIGPGDVIDISVWKDEALTKQVVVLPDGWINFPLIGAVKGAGRTVAQVKEEIAGRITEYVPDPVVSVDVKQVNSLLIYVIGRVNQPNRFTLNTNVTVLQGLAMCGGLNPFAKRDKIKILRYEGEKLRIIPFHYDDVLEGKRLDENIMLKRGDVIVVP